MTVIGHGIDIVDIDELSKWIEDPRNPLLSRCFVSEELDRVGEGPDRGQHLAGQYAAKEAVLKALGTGFGSGVALTDVVIHAQTNMAPTVSLTGGAAKAAAAQGIATWHVSVSHTDTIAMASAIAVGDP